MTDIKNELLEVKPVWFIGVRLVCSYAPVVVYVVSDKKRQLLTPNRSWRIRQHSSQFEWGYEGSGPAQLALAMLLTIVDEQTAEKRYQEFKRAAISRVDGCSWKIRLGDILSWLRDPMVKIEIADLGLTKPITNKQLRQQITLAVGNSLFK